MGITHADRSQYLTMVERRQRRGAVEVRKLESAIARGSDSLLRESSYADDYHGYFNQLARPRLVDMTPGTLHGKTWTERLFFYDAIGSHVSLSASWFSIAAECGEELYRHIIYRNYHYLSFPPAMVAAELQRHSWALTEAVMDALARLRSGTGIRDDLGRHDELVEFAYRLLEAEQRLEACNAG